MVRFENDGRLRFLIVGAKTDSFVRYMDKFLASRGCASAGCADVYSALAAMAANNYQNFFVIGWFNVDIQIKDHELLELTYTATFVHETLPQVMELLALMSPISYSISDRKEISKGTFARRKIILSYRKK